MDTNATIAKIMCASMPQGRKATKHFISISGIEWRHVLTSKNQCTTFTTETGYDSK